MSARGKRDSVVAGAFVIGGIIAATAFTLWLARAVEWFEKRTAYVVQFSIEHGAMGIQKGSEVRLGGQRVGHVTKVGFNPAEGPAKAIDVTVSIKESVALYKDAKFTLEQPLLGSVSTINIPYIGTPASQVAAENTVFPADVAAPSFLKSAGYGDEQRTQLQETLRDVREIAGRMKGLVEKVDDRVTPALDNVREASADLKAITGDVRSRLPQWGQRLSSILEAADGIAADAKVIPADVRAAIAVARKLLDEGAPKVQATLDSIQDLARKFNTETYDRVQRLIEQGDRALTAFADVGEGLKSELPGLRITLANVRLASDQLKLTLTEVRRNPWRLLYQPGKKELERELLYDSARAYAQAVSDLRAATASLEQVSAAGGARLPADQLDALKKQVDEALRNYREAEQAFMQRLLAE